MPGRRLAAVELAAGSSPKKTRGGGFPWSKEPSQARPPLRLFRSLKIAVLLVVVVDGRRPVIRLTGAELRLALQERSWSTQRGGINIGKLGGELALTWES